MSQQDFTLRITASLNLPPSDLVVRVQAIHTRAAMSLHVERFFEPSLENFSTLNLTNVCYLVSHPQKNRKILFDCGARKDFENYPPAAKSRLNAILKGITIEADVDEILMRSGISLAEIDSIVWSHWHWDHVGAAENFPRSTKVVVGPGFKENFMPGYPTNRDGMILDASFEGREVREIDFTATSLRIGDFSAFDFFGDGSFYLLGCPGHAIGHMCGLARTTTTTFVFMGADICHFSGMFRPSPGVPLPDYVPKEQLDAGFPSPCPCSLFTEHHPRVAQKDSEEARTTPFFQVTSQISSSYLDYRTARESIILMQEFDASPDVLVCIAHDPTLTKVLPFLNDSPDLDLNGWKERELKEKLLWGWLNELPRNGQPGRPMLIEGSWRSGKRITDFHDLEPTGRYKS